MTQSVLSVRMDQDTKEAFSQFCEEAGLSVSAAITLFARQTIRSQAIPFPITLRPVMNGVDALEQSGDIVSACDIDDPSFSQAMAKEGCTLYEHK